VGEGFIFGESSKTAYKNESIRDIGHRHAKCPRLPRKRMLLVNTQTTTPMAKKCTPRVNVVGQ